MQFPIPNHTNRIQSSDDPTERSLVECVRCRRSIPVELLVCCLWDVKESLKGG